jgi:hypothetical protein
VLSPTSYPQPVEPLAAPIPRPRGLKWDGPPGRVGTLPPPAVRLLGRWVPWPRRSLRGKGVRAGSDPYRSLWEDLKRHRAADWVLVGEGPHGHGDLGARRGACGGHEGRDPGRSSTVYPPHCPQAQHRRMPRDVGRVRRVTPRSRPSGSSPMAGRPVRCPVAAVSGRPSSSWSIRAGPPTRARRCRAATTPAGHRCSGAGRQNGCGARRRSGGWTPSEPNVDQRGSPGFVIIP